MARPIFSGGQGSQGPQGAQGATGAQGVQGVQGSQGAQGFQGSQGSQGFQGVQGSQGVQGFQGNQGYPGIDGADGADGADGVTGAQGFQGSQGSQGSQGAQGFQGAAGGQGSQGTGTTSTGAYGSEPGSPNAGDLYFPDNSYFLERYSGSAWVPWGPLFPFIAPVNGDFAWVNQGSATVSTTNGGIFLAAPADAGPSVRIRKKTAPSAPYKIDAFILPAIPMVSGNPLVGLTFRQSSDGKLHMFGLAWTAGTFFFYSIKYTDPTTFNAVYVQTAYSAGGVWLRIEDDNTNRKCHYSTDGVNFVQVDSIGRTDFLTADEVGFFANIANASFGVGVNLLSWRQS